MKKWQFDLGVDVIITCSGEHGEIIGRAEYPVNEDQYLVRYVAGDGRAVESWWSVSALHD